MQCASSREVHILYSMFIVEKEQLLTNHSQLCSLDEYHSDTFCILTSTKTLP